MSDPTYDGGMEVRREVLGDDHVDRAIAHTTEFTAPFQEFITRYAWGSVWTREQLDRRSRSADHADRSRPRWDARTRSEMHVRGALRNGLSARRDRRGPAAHRDLRRRARGQRRLCDRPARDRLRNDDGRVRRPARRCVPMSSAPTRASRVCSARQAKELADLMNFVPLTAARIVFGDVLVGSNAPFGAIALLMIEPMAPEWRASIVTIDAAASR